VIFRQPTDEHRRKCTKSLTRSIKSSENTDPDEKVSNKHAEGGIWVKEQLPPRAVPHDDPKAAAVGEAHYKAGYQTAEEDEREEKVAPQQGRLACKIITDCI
jgi:hypothetical protein